MAPRTMTFPMIFSRTSKRLAFLCAASLALAQTPAAPTAAQATPPPTIKLEDALARAKKYAGQIQSAGIGVLTAKEDIAQARAARLPSVNAFNQFIYTEANGTPSGVFVANDGVHVYTEQAVVHQELFSIVRSGELRRAQAAEALARAKVD